ncbi:MAG: Cof-type HAD-IIB family hydrolase [Hyphomicrobiales bacterium]
MDNAVRMIVMDLDDTLLNEDLEISPYTEKVVKNAQSQGIAAVIASGRPTPAIMPYARQLGLAENGGYVISYNGAIVTDCATGQDIFRCMLTAEDIELLLGIHAANDVFIHTYMDGAVVTPKTNEFTEFEGKLTGMPVREVDDLAGSLDRELVKILLLDEPARLKALEERLRPQIGDRLSMNISKPFFLEFTNRLVDKAKSIAFLCNRLGIDISDAMAIGDSYNDITMIRDSGFGVAMANAPADVKRHAKHITHCNNTDGVATAINRFALAV